MEEHTIEPPQSEAAPAADVVRHPEPYDFEVCKLCRTRSGRPVYKLRDTRLWVCSSCTAHYIDYLDPIAPAGDALESPPLTSGDREYFEKTQHYSIERLNAHVGLVQQYRNCRDLRVLDIGSGGGAFLAAMRDAGAEVCGLELAAKPAAYARETYGLDIHSRPVEDDYWRVGFRGGFDVVTLWDVIEHVNFPRETLQAAADLLKPGGLMMVGTPCRDAFYHRAGCLTAKATLGRYPTFLNVMYSSFPYAHKQILSVRDLERLFNFAGLRVLRTNVVVEHSLPCAHYMKRILRSKELARLSAPVVKAAFSVLNIRNKMISVGEKQA